MIWIIRLPLKLPSMRGMIFYKTVYYMPPAKRIPSQKQLDALAKGREKMCKKHTDPLEEKIERLERALATKTRQLKAFLE